MVQKLRYLFVPFVIALFGLLFIHSFIHWFFDIRLQWFGLPAVFYEFAMPLIGTAIIVLFWLRPKLILLDFRSKGAEKRNLYAIVMGLGILLPLVLGQKYLSAAAGQLTALSDIRTFSKQAPTKYYTIDHFYLDKNRLGGFINVYPSGKNNEIFNIDLYIVESIRENKEDTISTYSPAWLGAKYQKTISNSLTDFQKKDSVQAFMKSSEAQFKKKDLYQSTYFERNRNEHDNVFFLKAINYNPLYDSGGTILFPSDAAFGQRTGNLIWWFLGSMTLGLLLVLLLISLPAVHEPGLDRIKNRLPDPAASRNWEGFIDIFRFTDGYYGTPLLIILNLLFFVLMALAGHGFMEFDSEALLHWGALNTEDVDNGEYFRLLMSVFLHGGFLHLLGNMVSLYIVGLFIEPLIGMVRFLVIYAVCGICGSMMSLWWHYNTFTVGASGAIFGLYGLFLAMLLFKMYPPDFAKTFLITTVAFIGYNLVMGLGGGVDNAAHIGGLLAGFLSGFIIYFLLKKEREVDEMWNDTEPEKQNENGFGL